MPNPHRVPLAASSATAERLNRECFCIGTDVAGLQEALARELLPGGLAADLPQSHPHLFSSAPVFVAEQQMRRMHELIAAIESVVALPQWQAQVLVDAPPIARWPQRTRGLFMGYDFHIAGDGARLIEINTNAGGALLNLALARAQQACCSLAARSFNTPAGVSEIERRIVAMFREEWRLARFDAPLRRVAIVDTAPAGQYLYPEFLLCQRLLRLHGIDAVIVDPAGLVLRDGGLHAGDLPVDLVYNRLTDFYFEAAEHRVLREAYRSGVAVVTPHPQAHARYANKHNLQWLGDTGLLRSWGVNEATIAVLVAGIPVSMPVRPADAETLWRDRSGWFFKPATGFGSRGSYRGDKLTRKAFAQILAGDYVAQAMVPPTGRTTRHGDVDAPLKLDLRHYVYDGAVQLVAARLYQGQTTNFRTPGGGFAPVYVVPEGASMGDAGGSADPSSCGIAATSNCAIAADSSRSTLPMPG